MKKIFLCGIVLLVLLPVFASAATINAASCNLADVLAAINSAQRGDTVNVPAGSCIWSTPLAITKGMIIKGAGIDKTVITSGSTSIITYSPDSVSRANDDRFEVSGFTFTGSSSEVIKIFEDNGQTIPITEIVIHHNRFYDTGRITLDGNIYGVAYNNQFESGPFTLQTLGNQRESWDDHLPNPSSPYGHADNFYFEDNTIEGYSWFEGGHGGRYIARYNIWNNHNPPSVGTFDMHGNQPGMIYGTMICEVYGNIWTGSAKGNNWIEHRGGRVISFNNRVVGGTGGAYWMYVVDETDDSICPVNNPAAAIQHPIDSYYWNNWYNTIRIDAELKPSSLPTIAENSEFFNYNAACTSSSCSAGIGCGSTPPTGICTLGAGYWVTSYSPCSTPPATMADLKIYTQSGRFYKCTAQNTWSLYYTPYTYPHPLRNEGGTPLQCTDNDWRYTDGPCQPTNTLTRAWVNLGNCQGGVSHPSTETISCNYYNAILGDINNDGKVDISDLVIVAVNFGRTSGFDSRANVVSSSPEVIDIADLSFVARRFTG